MASQYLARSADRTIQYVLGDAPPSDPSSRVGALSPAYLLSGLSACSTLVQRIGGADRREGRWAEPAAREEGGVSTQM